MLPAIAGERWPTKERVKWLALRSVSALQLLTLCVHYFEKRRHCVNEDRVGWGAVTWCECTDSALEQETKQLFQQLFQGHHRQCQRYDGHQ